MLWIILTIVLAIVFWIGVFLYVSGRRREKLAEPGSTKADDAGFVGMVGLVGVLGSLTLWVLVTGFMMLHNVGEREVAVVYNFSGTISGKRDPGVVTTAPWQHVKKENVGILHDEWVFDDNNSAASIDQQKVVARLAVNYQIDAARILDLYRRVGPSWKTIIIDARVPQVFKETTATFTTPEVIQKREELRQRTKERLTAELDPYDIRVIDVFVTNLGFSQGYTESIERKQKQVQDALTAQAKVAEFEAVARQAIATAEGEAKANIARARGEAIANRLRRQSLTPLLVQQSAIERLNPKVTMIVCPPGSVCIPNSPIIPGQGGGGNG